MVKVFVSYSWEDKPFVRRLIHDLREKKLDVWLDECALKVGEAISIQRQNYAKRAVVTAIEMFRKQLQQAKAGDNVGLLLRDIGKQDIKRGDVLLRSDSEFS